ncbi:hypothetical protein BH09GEM1_BH09GEM1_30470 [soil metagenome]
MTVDWPLATELSIVFVVMSYVRWRWFRARMQRKARRGSPPV